MVLPAIARPPIETWSPRVSGINLRPTALSCHMHELHELEQHPLTDLPKTIPSAAKRYCQVVSSIPRIILVAYSKNSRNLVKAS
jgi:hypothetical protein